MEIEQFIADWWHENDAVVVGVFITLMILSLVSWAVIVYKACQFWRLEYLERRLVVELRDRDGSQPLAQWVAHITPSLLVFQEAARLPLGRTAGEDRHMQAHHLEHHAERLSHAQRVELESYLTGLATIGNAAPFIGLLGTVWGIMNALQGLGDGEALSIDVVSGPVGEALVATAMGLFVAIPAVVGYNLLLRRLRQLNVLTDRNLRHFIHLASVVGVDKLCEPGRA